MYDEDIVFKNNIVAKGGHHDIYIEGSGVPINTYRFVNNILADSEKEPFRQGARVIRLPGAGSLTVAQSQSQYPNIFKNNITTLPTIANPDVIAWAKADASRQRRISMNDFVLQDGSSGKGEATHLTVVTRSADNSQNLQVEDALYFFDGYGMVSGDEILVVNPNTGQTKARTRVTQTSINSNDTSSDELTVSPAVTAAVGDLIYLAKYQTSSDIGINRPGSGPTSTPVPTSTPGPILCFGNDNLINTDDLVAWVEAYFQGNVPDINSDGRINALEFGYLVFHWGETCGN